MIFSDRTNWDLRKNFWARSLEKEEKSDKPLIDLTVTNPTHCCFKYLSTSLFEHFSKKENLLYAPDSQGLMRCRLMIARYYKSHHIEVDPQDIFVTASTSEAYFLILRLLCNPGERVLSPSPSYPLLEYLADISDVCLQNYMLFYDDNWQINLDDLKQSDFNDIRAMILVNPNNPTGNYVDRADYKAIQKILAQRKKALIVDEVFSDYDFESEKKFFSLSEKSLCLTFTLNGLSKLLGLPQSKLSWFIITGPKEAKEKAKERLQVLSDAFLSANTISQNALESLMRKRKMIQKEIRLRILENYMWIKTFFKDDDFINIQNCQGGWSAILKAPGFYSDSEWCQLFLDKGKVVVYPGYLFDLNIPNTMVLSLLTEPKLFQKGCRIIQKIISSKMKERH